MPGCDRDPYLEELFAKCQELGNDIVIYHLYDHIIREAAKEGVQLNKNNILDFYDANPSRLIGIREKAVLSICDEISRKESVHVISSPNYFEWKGSNLQGFRNEDLDKFNLDMIIIITDDLSRIKDRLLEDIQWKSQRFTYTEIAKWRRDSIDSMWNYAYSKEPPIKIFLVAVEHDIKVLYDLIFHDEKPKAYLSYPITGVSPELIEEERKMGNLLASKFIIFDPLTIKDWQLVTKWKELRDRDERPELFDCDIEYKSGLKKFKCSYKEIESAIKDIRHQIVDRDYKLIEQSDYIIVYHPRKEISVGVVCEMVHGKMGGQMVYLMYPFEPSPFFEYHSTQIFKSREEMLTFFDI